MKYGRRHPHRLLRWLLAGWLVVLPLLSQAMPLVGSEAVSSGEVAMPCHDHMVDETPSSATSECPNCTANVPALCKCCSFATSATVPISEVSTHFLIARSEKSPSTTGSTPPVVRPERLYRPPIHLAV